MCTRAPHLMPCTHTPLQRVTPWHWFSERTVRQTDECQFLHRLTLSPGHPFPARRSRSLSLSPSLLSLPNPLSLSPSLSLSRTRAQAAGDDSIKTLTALAVDELLLNGNLENARLLFQVCVMSGSSDKRRGTGKRGADIDALVKVCPLVQNWRVR